MKTSIKHLKNILNLARNSKDALLIEGVHGIGKSTIVRQWCNDNQFHLEELYLSNQEVGDLIGNIRTVEVDGEFVTTWTKPIWLHRMHQKAAEGISCVLHLEELNRAETDVRQSALQLVLEGKIHEHSLPEGTFIVSSVNPGDDYQTYELDPALLSRFLFIKLDVDTLFFLENARKKNLNKVIVSFLSEFPEMLHYKEENDEVGANPRSWEKLSSYLDFNIKDELFYICQGKLGSVVGAKFYTYYQNFNDIFDIEDIIDIIGENSEFSIIETSNIIKTKMDDVESIRKLELAWQLTKDFDSLKIPLLIYLYSLNIEVCVSFLKSLRNENADVYEQLVQLDNKLNNKELFIRIVRMSLTDV